MVNLSHSICYTAIQKLWCSSYSHTHPLDTAGGCNVFIRLYRGSVCRLDSDIFILRKRPHATSLSIHHRPFHSLNHLFSSPIARTNIVASTRPRPIVIRSVTLPPLERLTEWKHHAIACLRSARRTHKPPRHNTNDT